MKTRLLPPQAERPLIFVPHLAGERSPAWVPAARGSWLGLAPEHSARELRQAVLEGTAFALRSLLDHMETLLGPQAQIRVSGRERDNLPWLHLRASIYRRPLAILHTHEPTALGAMMVAAVGIGWYPSIPAAVAAITDVQAIVEPDSEQVDRYDHLYKRYLIGADAVRSVASRWAAA